MSQSSVKAIMAAVHLDQLLYDSVIRKAPYTHTRLVVDFIEDFFVFTLSRRLEMMFLPIDNAQLPEQIGKVVITTMLHQTPLDRCKTLITTYPCEFITDADQQICRNLNVPPCFPKSNPPRGFGFGTWELVNGFVELLSRARNYENGGNDPYLILRTQEYQPPLGRKKRAAYRGLPRRRPKNPRRGSSSSSRSGGSRRSQGSSRRNVNRQVMRTLGAGTGVGAGLGAGKNRLGAVNPGMFNTLSLQDIRRMGAANRLRAGSVSGTPSISSATGTRMANPSPVALTNLRARPASFDSYQMNSPLARPSSSSAARLPSGSTSGSASGSSRISTRGQVAVPQSVVPQPVVPQPIGLPPVPAPRSGWRDMPPLDPPSYYIHDFKKRPSPAVRRNLAGDRPLTRSYSSTSLDSLDSSPGNSRSPSRLTNEGGTFLPQVREDFKLHNRVGDSMRTFESRHPYWTKAGKYVGTGVAGLGAYVGVSQIDRAIQKAQDEAEENKDEKHKNLTDTLEADLFREKLANEKFKQQSEFASQVLAEAIKTGNVPTALLENVTQRQPVNSVPNYGSWPMVNRGKN